MFQRSLRIAGGFCTAALVVCIPATKAWADAASTPAAQPNATPAAQPNATPAVSSPATPGGNSLDAGNVPATQDAATSAPGSSDRYGLLNLLDHRSVYGKYFFPEPFRMDEADVDNELRGDYLYTTGKGQRVNLFHAEVEKSFGLLTLEAETTYEKTSFPGPDPVTGDIIGMSEQGVGNIDLGARHPVYQWVSQDGVIDNTVGVAFEVGIPSGSEISKNSEIVPKLFDAVRLGDHFSFQTIVGWSNLFGPGEDGGLQTFEYGMLFGYNIDHAQLPIPGVEQVIPLVEITGESQLNHDDAGHSIISATIGPRVNFKSIGAFQPRIGVGYVIPLDKGARDEFQWGIITSLVFEY